MEIAVVRPGETLWQIANRYGTTIPRIATANGLTDVNRLVPGMALVIPVERQHVVKYGETLWLISRLYGTTPEAIAKLNGLSLTDWIYPGQVLRIPRGTRPAIESNAYQTNFGPKGVATTGDAAPYLTYVSDFSFPITEEGDVLTFNTSPVDTVAHQARAATAITITNFRNYRFDSDLASAFLNSSAAQDRALDELLTVMRRDGHTDLNVDFEYVYPRDREAYNSFLRRAAPRLHDAGFRLSTALAPKVRADQIGLLYEAHDYPAHGEIVDFTVLMTYEWGYVTGPPMAIAPLNEVKRVLDYAVTAIPRSKIMMGMPLYGRDWKLPYQRGVTRAETLSPVAATDRAIQQGVAIQYDPVGESPYYRYWDAEGQEHVVWFEDARSVQAKFDTVKEYGLRGLSYWVLGNPFPQNWLLLGDNFEITKIER